MKTVFTVAYTTEDDPEPIVTVFDNKETAEAYLKYIGNNTDDLMRCCMDECPVYHKVPQTGDQTEHLVWAYVKHRCMDCNHEMNMYIEEGLEQGGATNKPIPFGMTCPECGGFSRKVSGIIPLPGGSRSLNANEHYFKNTSKDRYGIPVHPFEVKK